MGLGNNVLFEESFKSRIYLSPLYTRKNTLRENSLGICSKITTIGVYGKCLSWEHSLAIGPFFLSSIHWWTILGRDRECTLHLDHMGSMACWPLTSCVALGKSAELVVPRYSIYWMETIIGVSFQGCFEDQMKQFMESTLPGHGSQGTLAIIISSQELADVLYQVPRGGFFCLFLFHVCNNISK